MKSLDTKVEGDPARVTSAATWLRGTLAPNLQMAAEDQQDARRPATDVTQQAQDATRRAEFRGFFFHVSSLFF